MDFYKKIVFWQNVQKTLSLISGPTVYTLNELQVDNTLMLACGLIAFLTAVLSIWFVDTDNDGIVDLFKKD